LASIPTLRQYCVIDSSMSSEVGTSVSFVRMMSSFSGLLAV